MNVKKDRKNKNRENIKPGEEWKKYRHLFPHFLTLFSFASKVLQRSGGSGWSDDLAFGYTGGRCSFLVVVVAVGYQNNKIFCFEQVELGSCRIS